VVLIEDTRELQCKAANLVALRTKDGIGSLSDLVRSSLRLRPDRIPIGEVRPRAVDYAAHIKNALDAAAINVRRAKPVRRMSGWTCGI
jgi:type IV secretory pathway ATPase VirB11/archaellum biosynthesis ATPase